MYIATFYTHYGAQTFNSMLKKQKVACKVMPVPRALSAACGICVSFEDNITEQIQDKLPEDLEGLYRVVDKKFETIIELD